MKKLLTLTAAVFLFLGAHAQASTLATVTLGPTSSDISFSLGGSLSPNILLTTLSPAQLTLTGNAAVITPSTITGPDFIPPESGTDFGNSYLSVFAHPSTGGVYINPTPGTAVFNLAAFQHIFGFTWGSVDSGNKLVLQATNATYTLTGTDIANAILGGQTFGDADLVFNDTAGSILSATFTSSNNAFETANFESAVPLPASLPLFGAALLLGVGIMARRRGMI